MDDLSAYFAKCPQAPSVCVCGHRDSEHSQDEDFGRTICLSRTPGKWGLRKYSEEDTMCPCFQFRTSGERKLPRGSGDD